MEAPPLLPKKKDVLEALLGDSNVFLHLDPRKQGVVVPKWFQNQPELVLQLGLRMAVPIPDLEVDDEGVSCTLSFNRTPFWCCMPWSSIFAVISDKDRRGVVWPEDVPPDGQSAKNLKPPAAKRERPKLTALGPNDRLEPEPASGETEVALPPIGPDSTCNNCGTRWIEDQTSCPVCGATAAEGLARPPSDKIAAEKAPSENPAVLEPKADDAGPTSEPDSAGKKRAASKRKPDANGNRAPSGRTEAFGRRQAANEADARARADLHE
jgi:stringent starvation protein B